MALLPVLALFCIGLSILFGSHYVLYISAVRLFSISNPDHRAILFITLGVLAVSFPFATLFAHLHEDLFTRALYFSSTLWLGVLTNLVMAAALAWATLALFHAFHGTPNASIIAGALAVLAIACSAYGIWNALHPRVTEITVSIPNLPASWRGAKIVQLSDVHLGHVFREGFMKDVVATVNGVSPKMVVITGDLFDGMDGNLNAFADRINDINAAEGTYFVTGNHETYLGAKKAFTVLEATNIHILNDKVADVDGLKVIGISYPEQNASKNMPALLEKLAPQFAGQPSILLYHAPTNIEDFKKAGVNLQLSGHTHEGQIFPFRYITRLLYKGYDYGLHTDGAYSIYTTSGTGAWGPTMRTGNVPEIVVITLE